MLNSTFASFAPSGTFRSIQASLGAGEEVSILVVSIYLVGYILGPIVFVPVVLLSVFLNRSSLNDLDDDVYS